MNGDSSLFARQEAILRAAITAHDGYTYKQIGDAFQAAFQTAPAALAAAGAAQQALAAEPWPATIGPLCVRMALHTGTTDERADDYVGPVLNRVARLLSAGHGGQILLSAATYELVRDTLPAGAVLRDLGAHRLKDLVRPEHVWQMVVPGLPTEFPPLRTLDARPNNLPAQPNACIGREAELATVAGRLRQPAVRLLTLTGPGGVGKTRLALQLAADLLDDYADGVFFVPLAPLVDPELVVPTIAQTLDLPAAGARPPLALLTEGLRHKACLLVLDNFEHVAAAAAALPPLLAAAPRLKVLVTSRAPLQLYGEQEFAVPPLALPTPHPRPALHQLTQYAAVRLFIARALEVHPDFAVTNANAPAVAEICARLDGLPLAIELAAARVRLFPPEALLARLESRLALLTGGGRDRPARQQTLRGAIAWSYDLLSAGEQQLFRRLAVFQGGATLDAIEAVCGGPAEVLAGVDALLRHSLVQQQTGGADAPRIAMLATIHEYARERLTESGEEPAVRHRHLHFFQDLAEQAAPGLQGPEQAAWVTRLATDWANLDAALAWARAGAGIEAGLRLAGALWFFGTLREILLPSMRGRLAPLLAHRSGAPPRVQAHALFAAGRWALQAEELREVAAHYQASLALFRALGDRGGSALVLNGLGSLADMRGEREVARVLLEESLEIRRAIGDPWGTSQTLGNLALLAVNQGAYTTARRLLEEVLVIRRAVGDPAMITGALGRLSELLIEQGDYARARACAEEGLTWAAGDTFGAGWMRHLQGLVAACAGAYGQAAVLLGESRSLLQEAGASGPLVYLRVNQGVVAGWQGEYRHARALLKDALAGYRKVGAAGESGYVFLALGWVELRAGNHAQAAALFGQALVRLRGAARPWILARSLAGATVVLARSPAGAEPCVRLAGATARHLTAMGVQLWPADRADWESAVGQMRARLDSARFQAAWTTGQALSWEQAIHEALAALPAILPGAAG